MEATSFYPSHLSRSSVKVLHKYSQQNNNNDTKDSAAFNYSVTTTIKPTTSAKAIIIVNGAFLLIAVTILALPHAQAFNDEKGILKWNPYWFSNFRYSAPSSFYISPNRVGTPYKRVSESAAGISGGSGSNYKWSPVYFSGGSSYSSPPSSFSSSLQQPSTYLYGTGTTGLGGGGYMYSPNRPRWSLSDYGGSRFLTKYYGGNSFFPAAVPRSSNTGTGAVGEPAAAAAAAPASLMDLAGSNDLSALLGEELMNNGLGLENDSIDILDGENTATQHQQQKAH